MAKKKQTKRASPKLSKFCAQVQSLSEGKATKETFKSPVEDGWERLAKASKVKRPEKLPDQQGLPAVGEMREELREYHKQFRKN